MRRVVFGLAVLAALSVGAGAYAFGGAGRPSGDRPAATATSGASEPSDPAPDASTPAPPAGTAPAGPGPSSSPSSSAAGNAAPAANAATGKPAAACPQGEKQRQVETALASIGGYGPVTVDGVQSPDDCAAIVKFQKRFGISPANGRAGPTTGDVARRIAASHTAEVRAKCRPAASGMTACIDLTLQTVWVVRNGAVVWGPTVTRTGFRGYATPVGTFKIRYRNIREWSNPYEVWMPYWQNFVGGIGFHQTTTYLHNGSIGSHGCVNLLGSDARALWNLIGNGTTVQTFGRRPGT
jgi:lipoprotein-anchoring transpeptidase ErfK/SrfK